MNKQVLLKGFTIVWCCNVIGKQYVCIFVHRNVSLYETTRNTLSAERREAVIVNIEYRFS